MESIEQSIDPRKDALQQVLKDFGEKERNNGKPSRLSIFESYVETIRVNEKVEIPDFSETKHLDLNFFLRCTSMAIGEKTRPERLHGQMPCFFTKKEQETRKNSEQN